jgi:putative transposase
MQLLRHTGTCFFTVNLAERDRTLQVDHVDSLRSAMAHVKAGHPFHIDAAVIPPDHLHTIWTLPEGDFDYPVRWALINSLEIELTRLKKSPPAPLFQRGVIPPFEKGRSGGILKGGRDNYGTINIKAGFSRRISSGEQRNASRLSKGERGIWQRRYWEHVIRDERDYERHIDYIHYNPVRHGHVCRASDWPYSSIHRYIAAGIVDRDWGAGPQVEEDRPFGER